MEKVNEYIDKNEKKIKEQHLSFEEVFNRVPVDVILMPNQKYYILDRHHGAYAIWKMQPDCSVEIAIKHDLSHMSFDEAALFLYRNSLIYLSSADVARIEKKQTTVSKILQAEFPLSLANMQDNPWRSKIADFLKEKRIEARDLVPFAEFKMEDLYKQQTHINYEQENWEIIRNDFYLFLPQMIKSLKVVNRCYFLFI